MSEEGPTPTGQNGAQNEDQAQYDEVRLAAPPTQAGPLYRPQPGAGWPTVIGVIGIVFGAGALLMTVAGVAFSLMMRNAPNAPPMPQFSGRWLPWTIIMILITCGLAVLLLIAGIGIAKRLAWGPRIARVWAVFKILLVIASTIVGFQTQQAAIAAMKQNTGPAPMLNFRVLMEIGICFGLLWGWALPVFMLIWFARRSIKEQTSKWR
jgi:hypothetical protein